jgi:hypothetical protein
MLADPELKSEEVKKAYTTKKELLDKASTGDVEAGR